MLASPLILAFSKKESEVLLPMTAVESKTVASKKISTLQRREVYD